MFRSGMLKDHARSLDLFKRGIDIFCILLASYIAYHYKFEGHYSAKYKVLVLLNIGLVIFFFNWYPLYRSWRGISFFTELKTLCVACFTVFVIIIVLAFFLKVSNKFSREYATVCLSLQLILLSSYRIVFKRFIVFLRKAGHNRRRIAMIGYPGDVKYIYELIINKPEFGFEITDIFIPVNVKTDSYIFKDKIRGGVSDFADIVLTSVFDQIWVVAPIDKVKLLKIVTEKLRDSTADIRFIPNLRGFNLINHSFSEIAGIPFFNVSSSPMQDGINKILKRIEDIILSIIILILVLPVIVVASFLIKITSPGPVYYLQKRMGLNNKVFNIVKFRSMPVDVESNTGAVWAKKGEKRTTVIGGFLRKTSIDELPQFWNVLKGEMSIVGPRPERPEFVEKFRTEIPQYMKKHMVKAGITGWAQVNGWRGNTDLQKRIEHDIYYIENWSLLFDLKIILMTFCKGMINKNAY